MAGNLEHFCHDLRQRLSQHRPRGRLAHDHVYARRLFTRRFHHAAEPGQHHDRRAWRDLLDGSCELVAVQVPRAVSSKGKEAGYAEREGRSLSQLVISPIGSGRLR